MHLELQGTITKLFHSVQIIYFHECGASNFSRRFRGSRSLFRHRQIDMLTCFVTNRPDQQIHARGVGHHIHLKAIHGSEIRVDVLALARVVLSRLQFRLTRKKQALHELLHVPCEWSR